MPTPSPGEFAELERLFHEALARPPADRAAFVTRQRAESPALGDQLAALLAADGGDTTLQNIVSAEARATAPGGDSLIGERFGAYRLERVIGRGGMGAVYLGRRVDAAFEQEVAIKTLLSGWASPVTLERFRRERGILARLNHPNIARLLDGGSGPGGVPYVAMEFVAGVPITQHAATTGAGLPRRLELFVELCGAVEFVHRNLIVHRDIKPGNVLVTAEGRVKLLDFGIAKLADEFEAQAAPTGTGLRAMTPEYASPEQILGQPVTTAADIYALGVLLYELVSGVRPVQFSSTNPYELAREIVAKTPVPPSQAASQTAAPFVRQLRGDLDRVILMTLRKEPDRRYPSVAALAADVRAWLAGRPVTAQTDTWRYRLRKRIGRHPVATAATVLVTATVLGFTALTVWQRRLIETERDNALVAARRSKATSDFLVKLFRAGNPREGGKRNTTVFDLLQTGVADLRADATLDAEVRADLFLQLGHSLGNLDELAAGIESFRASLAESERAYGRDSLETAERLHRLGDALRRVRQHDEAFAVLSEALEIRRRHMRAETYEIADSYNNLAILAVAMGKYVESNQLQTESIAMHSRLTGDRSPAVGIPLNNLALLRRRAGRYPEALDLATRAFEILRLTEDRDGAWLAQLNMAAIRREMGAVDDAQALFEKVVGEARAALGPNHTRIVLAELDIARCLMLKGEYERAGRMHTELGRRIREAFGSGSDPAAVLMRDEGLLLAQRGRLVDAEAKLRQALEQFVRVAGARNQRGPSFRLALAEVLGGLSKWQEAERHARETIDQLPDPAVYPHIERAIALTILARTQRMSGRSDEARAALAEARDIIRQTTGEHSREMARVEAETRALPRDPS